MVTTENLSASKALTGFVKIWQSNPDTGESVLLIDKQNMILKGGAKLIAQCLGGKTDSKIWGMYIGYNNSVDFDPAETAPPIDVDYSHPFSDFKAGGDFGYLREPLTFAPNYLSSVGYDSNTVLFSTMITTATSAGGAVFNTASKIYEVALVAVPDVTNTTKDVVFSRTNFNAIQYNSSYNFTITWGVRIILPE
jgi:hypothetical protein